MRGGCKPWFAAGHSSVSAPRTAALCEAEPSPVRQAGPPLAFPLFAERISIPEQSSCSGLVNHTQFPS